MNVDDALNKFYYVGKYFLDYLFVTLFFVFCNSLQLCTNVTVPSQFGGIEGEALFIDTEGSFVIQRLAQIGNAKIISCKNKIKGIFHFYF